MFAGLIDFLQPRQLRFGQALAPQQIDHAIDGIERRADFVAHVGKEGALGTVGRFGFVPRQAEFVRACLDQAFQPFAILRQLRFDLLALGHITGAADGADDLAVVVDEWGFLDIQTEVAPTNVACFLKL